MARGVIALDLASKHFGDRPVLGPIAFAVAPGEAVALTGPSGAGKTTLLRILAGLDRDFEGSLSAPARIAMVFQEPTLLPWRDAAANIMLTTGADAATAERLLGEVGLAGRGAAYPGQLSLGQQRRLALARALAAEPELLLLDEPFVSLDPALVEEMLTLTEAVLRRRRAASVLVTHSRAEAERLADRIVTLGGSPARIVSEERP
ncbi:ATP-binding cassette domain-containing protein [Amaricoccus solimangrovi]|uniref:ABC transporter ATP-binding protein n=1 Tax=Amaricoccus solimangrovi TaxID=2589815 RepID=A0A501WVB2_9RHOB|nr:ATP-binding cassette domain-containing protein [Amaricoccus solimangrovi]TPE52245.1 ABC transporter ATP-binding protein [Amaricoccus solimangrovi]